MGHFKMLTKPYMRTVIRVLAVYTLAVGIFDLLSLITLTQLNQITSWVVIAVPLLMYSIPLIVFAIMVLFRIRSGAARKVLYVLAGYTFLLFLFVLFEILLGPPGWYKIIAFLDLPALALAGLVLLALRRDTIMYL
jgi:hypothetical protein